MKYDVFGIGSALMDFLIEVDDSHLVACDLKKGQFHLIDEAKLKELLQKSQNVKTAPGGSSANTLYGVALLGGSVVFCGKVGRDSHGDVYEQKMSSGGVTPRLGRSDKKTGHAITYITPDSQRTFAVHLGASLHLAKEDVFFDDLKQSTILHIEGYQLEDPSLRSVSLEAMKFAKQHKVQISIDLGDPGIVSRNKEDILSLVQDYADIVFANAEEAKALTGLEIKDALAALSRICKIAVVKDGKSGSFIKQGDIVYDIAGFSVTAVDTTGAGDMYAAGVLYGITHGLDLAMSGKIGSYFAAKVCGQIGARLDRIDVKEVEKIKNDN